jgi:hypothetical protein
MFHQRNTGDVIEVEIDRISNSGNIVAYTLFHRMIFVDRGKPGDNIWVRVNDKNRGERVSTELEEDLRSQRAPRPDEDTTIPQDDDATDRPSFKSSETTDEPEVSRSSRNDLLNGKL